MRACLQLRWRCQKHPCTKMQDPWRGRTMSGLPGRSRLCNRKRYPIECRMRRTASSGFVCLPRIRLIKRLRFSGLKVSAITAKTCPGFG
jgi:hypothetical protein